LPGRYEAVCVAILCMQRQRRVHKERLMNEFTSALSNFQSAQRLEKEREKQCISRSHHVAVSRLLYFLQLLLTRICGLRLCACFLEGYKIKSVIL